MATATQPPETKPAGRVAAAIRDAAFATLLAFGMCVPIIALRTEQDIDNRLVLIHVRP